MFRLALLFLLTAGGLVRLAGAAQNWDRLSDLRSGDTIAVTHSAGEQVGAFVAVTADSLTIQTAGTESRIERARVSKVVLRSKSRRLRNALIGVGIGVAVALAVDRTIGTYLNNEGHYDDGTRALVWTVPVGLFGGIGAAVASHPTIYKAPRP